MEVSALAIEACSRQPDAVGGQTQSALRPAGLKYLISFSRGRRPSPPSPPRFSALLAFQCHPILVSKTTASEQRTSDKGEVLASLHWLRLKTLPSLIFSELHNLFVREKRFCNSHKLRLRGNVCALNTSLFLMDCRRGVETNNPPARRSAALSDTLLCFLFSCGRGRIFGNGKAYGSNR